MYSSGMGSACCTLAIARHLSSGLPDASFLVITDLPVFGRFQLPDNLDYVHVPRVLGVHPGGDAPASHLDSDDTVRAIRRQLIGATFESFDPHLVIVDRTPLGIGNELRSALAEVRRHRRQTRIVAGLWDVPGEASTIRERWQREGVFDSLAHLYDEVWVYGSPQLFDPVREYAVPPEIARKLFFTGYLRHEFDASDARAKLASEGFDLERPLVLVTVGGGRHGYPLANAYLDSLEAVNGSCDFQSHVVCGPMMSSADKDALDARVRRLPSVSIDRFHKDLTPYVRAASTVVSTLGYNTCCQILSFQKQAIIAPRSTASSDELLRARMLERQALVQTLPPEEFSAERLGELLLGQLLQPAPEAYPDRYRAIPLDGLDNIAKRVIEGSPSGV